MPLQAGVLNCNSVRNSHKKKDRPAGAASGSTFVRLRHENFMVKPPSALPDGDVLGAVGVGSGAQPDDVDVVGRGTPGGIPAAETH